MKVLVTGAGGFMGSELTKELVNEGYDVHILTRPKSDLSSLKEIKVTTLYGDVTDQESVNKALQGMEVVFHLAGIVAYSKNERSLMEKVNVTGTSHVVEACLKNSVKRLIHMSSVAAIGASFTPDKILNEESPYELTHLNLGYFETKKKGEELVKKATLQQGLNAIILNPATVYGPGDAKKGSRKTQVKVARGEFPFYPSGGVNVIDIRDVVVAILMAMKVGKSGERYILAGENLLIKDLFKIIAQQAGVNPPKLYLPRWALHGLGGLGDVLNKLGLKGPISSENAWTSTLFHWFDSSKAKRELNLKPRPAIEALHASVEWMRLNGLLN